MTTISIKHPGMHHNLNSYETWKKNINSEIYSNLYTLQHKFSPKQYQLCQKSIQNGTIQLASWNLDKLSDSLDLFEPIINKEVTSQNNLSREKLRIRNKTSCYPVWKNESDKDINNLWEQLSNQIQSVDSGSICPIHIENYIDIQKKKHKIVDNIRDRCIHPEWEIFNEPAQLNKNSSSAKTYKLNSHSMFYPSSYSYQQLRQKQNIWTTWLRWQNPNKWITHLSLIHI